MKPGMQSSPPFPSASGAPENQLEQVMKVWVTYHEQVTQNLRTQTCYMASPFSTTGIAFGGGHSDDIEKEILGLIYQNAYRVFQHHHSPEESASYVSASWRHWTVSIMEGAVLCPHSRLGWICLHCTHLHMLYSLLSSTLALLLTKELL